LSVNNTSKQLKSTASIATSVTGNTTESAASHASTAAAEMPPAADSRINKTRKAASTCASLCRAAKCRIFKYSLADVASDCVRSTS
jgi:hypothetical protein